MSEIDKIKNQIKATISFAEKILWILLLFTLFIGAFGTFYLLIINIDKLEMLEIVKTIGFGFLLVIIFIVIVGIKIRKLLK